MSFYDIIQALLRWLKNSSAFSAKMAQLYNSVYSLLSPFRMVCRDFILPEPANYVFFCAVSNLRKLLYIIECALQAQMPAR